MTSAFQQLGFRESVRRVGAESRAQQAITSAGVQVFDQQSGRMRSIVDIMSDFAQVTATMSDEERNRREVTAFGARAAVFKPIVRAVVDTLNAILRAFQASPHPSSGRREPPGPTTPEDNMNKESKKRMRIMEELRLPELQARFHDIVGEATRSPNK